MAGDATLVFRWIQWKHFLSEQMVVLLCLNLSTCFQFLMSPGMPKQKTPHLLKRSRFCWCCWKVLSSHAFQQFWACSNFKQCHLRRIPIFNLTQHLVLNICLGWEEKRLLGLVTFGGSAFQARAVAVSRVLYVSRPAPDPHLKGQYALNGGGWI